MILAGAYLVLTLVLYGPSVTGIVVPQESMETCNDAGQNWLRDHEEAWKYDCIPGAVHE